MKIMYKLDNDFLVLLTVINTINIGLMAGTLFTLFYAIMGTCMVCYIPKRVSFDAGNLGL
jgi:hypothetical protein